MSDTEHQKTVRKIIEAAGGASAVADGCSGDDKRLTADAVYKWQSNGIPDRYWSAIIPMAAVTADEIFAANEIARNAKAQESAA